jgi:hypothetical protein
MGLRDRPSDKPVSLLMPTSEPVNVGQASGEEPEDMHHDKGPLLVPLEGFGKLADAQA